MLDINASGGGQTDERGRLSRAAHLIAAMTALSRLAGLARDAAVSAVFGAGMGADAFFVAFRIPNLLRRVVAEGATSAAFVPVFTEHLASGGPVAAARAAGAVGGAAFLVLTALTLAGMAASEPLTVLFAPGFTRDEAKQALTISLTFWTFPYVLFVGAAAWAMGVLHTFRRFALPAAGPVLMNLAVVVSALALAPRLGVPAYGLVAGILVGGFLQFGVQIPELRRLGLSRAMFLELGHPAVRRSGRMMVAALLGGAVYQINVLVATVFASLLPEGTVAYLWYADRLFEFPLGIVAVAVGTAALPSLAGQARAGHFTAMGETVVHAMSLTVAFCLPAAVGLWMLSYDITSLLFERGNFSAGDTAMTSWALRAFVPGLLGVGLVRVLASAFYALERPRVPVFAGLLTLLLNALLGLALMGPVDGRVNWWGGEATAALGRALHLADLRHAGLAAATGIAATVNALVLLLVLRAALPGLRLSVFGRSAALHAVAAMVMAAAVAVWLAEASTWGFAGATGWRVAGAVVVGGVSYLAMALALGSPEVGELLGSAGLGRRGRRR